MKQQTLIEYLFFIYGIIPSFDKNTNTVILDSISDLTAFGAENWSNKVDQSQIVEQRFFDFLNSNENAFTFKFRYKLQTKIPINNVSLAEGTYYVKLSAELFADLAIVDKATNSDRNRFELGVGYLLKRNQEIQVIYLLQRNKNNIEDIIQNDNVLRISFFQRFGYN